MRSFHSEGFEDACKGYKDARIQVARDANSDTHEKRKQANESEIFVSPDVVKN